jgi:hypothetical protein
MLLVHTESPGALWLGISGGGGNVQCSTGTERKLGHADHVLPSAGNSLEESTIGNFVELLDEGCVVLRRRGRMHHGVGQGVLWYVR